MHIVLCTCNTLWRWRRECELAKTARRDATRSHSVRCAERLGFAHERSVVRLVVAARGQPARRVAVRAAEHIALLCAYKNINQFSYES